MATKTNTKSNSKSNTNTTPPWEEKVKAGSKTVNATDYTGWNNDIKKQADTWTSQGKNVYYAQDNNGAWHVTTLSQDRANEIANKYNTTNTAYNIGGKTYNVTPSTSNNTKNTNSNYLLTAGQTGSYADLANMAQAYFTGDTYTPNQTIDTDFWSTAGGGGKNLLYNNTKDYVGKAFGVNDMAQVMKYANLYQQQQAYKQATNDMTAQVESYVQPYIQYLQNAQTESSEALQNANEASKSAINTAYDDTARKYYQLYKTQNAKLPENLSLAGVTGGASESAQLNLLNTYANNLYNNESGRNTQLANVESNYNDQVASNSISAANSIADAYLQLVQQKMAYDREDAQLAAEAQQTAEEKAAAQKLESRNASVRKRMLEQLNKGDTIWSWEDESGALHWTTYKAVAETYKSTYKVTELTTKDKDKVSSLGKTTTKSPSGGEMAYNSNPFDNSGDGSPVLPKSADYDRILKAAKVGVISPVTIEKTVEMIKNANLTQAEKNQIYKEVGLV